MRTIVYAQQAVFDFERLVDFAQASFEREQTVELIVSAVATLTAHPSIGRPVSTQLRELVISVGETGSVAL
jgi:plasmid stabilization system protein ParE